MTVLPEIRRELIATANRNSRPLPDRSRTLPTHRLAVLGSAACAIAVVIAVCVVVVTSIGDHASPVRSGTHARSQTQKTRLINTTRHRPIAASLVAHYALFRSYPTYSPARHPNLPTPGIRGGYTGEMHLNYWQTRYIPMLTGLDGPGIWVTPGARGLCISDPQVTSCGTLNHQRDTAGFIGPGTIGKHQETLSGVVPDGNQNVTLVLADGQQVTTPVIHNVYEATVPGKITAIINRNTAGQTVRHQY